MKIRSSTKFQASHTILQKWASGQHEEAVYAYFGRSQFDSKQLQSGRDFHTLWLEETKRTNRLPGIFGGAELKNPSVEQKYVLPLEDWLDLAFIIDCHDQDVVYDYKTGSTPASSYINGFQGGVYGFGCQLLNAPVKEFRILHYDQYLRRKDTAFRWITPQYLQETHDWIRTNAWAMHRYLYNHNLYEQFNTLPA